MQDTYIQTNSSSYVTTSQPQKKNLKLNKHPVSCTRNKQPCHSAPNRCGPSEVTYARITLGLHPPCSPLSLPPRCPPLCFLLLLHLLPVKGQISVPHANVQHLQLGQMCEGALVHCAHGQAVKAGRERPNFFVDLERFAMIRCSSVAMRR